MRKKKGLALLLDATLALVVISVLFGLVLHSTSRGIEEARIARAKSDLAVIGAAISQYKYEIDSYPTDVKTLTIANGIYGPWLPSEPKDPWHQASYTITITGSENTLEFTVSAKNFDNETISFTGK